MHLPPTRTDPVGDEPPPFLGSWRRVYAAIVIYLAVIILLFQLFTAAFNR